MTKLLLLTSILSITACATDPASTDAPAADISFVSRTGTTIEIYDEHDGAFGVAEIGDAAHVHEALPVETNLSPSQIYALSAGATDVPAEITALTAKLVAAGREFPTTTPVSQVQRPDATTCTATFMKVQCDVEKGNEITWCLLDATTPALEDHTQVDNTAAEICVERGTLDYRITNGAGTDHLTSLAAGDWETSSHSVGAGVDIFYTYAVTNVAGAYNFVGEANQ